VLDSGFCVLKAIIALYEKGLYAGALIKKRRYWPTLVPGDVIDSQFANKRTGDIGAIEGKLNGSTYWLWGIKEPNYVMKIMATGGVLATDDTCKTAVRGNGNDRVLFKYTKPFDWHFWYRHAVDDHNNLCHALPSLDDTWATTRWEIRVFTFLLAIYGINAYLALRFFKWAGKAKMTLLQFRRHLASFMVDNPWLPTDYNVSVDEGSSLEVACDVVIAPNHAREFRYGRWVCDAKAAHQQYVCRVKGCQKQVRTCCACSPGSFLCTTHIVQHAVSKAKSTGQ
jgi:hypothetical protein